MTYSLVGPSTPLPEIEPGDYTLPSSHFSFSQFRSFRTCPACFEAKYILKQREPLGPNLVIGSAIHAALELGRRALMDQTEIPSTEALKDATADGFEDSLAGKDRQGNAPEVPPILKLGERDKSWGHVKDKAISVGTYTIPRVLTAESAYTMLAVEAQVDMRGCWPFPFAAYVDRVLDDPSWETFGQIGDDKTQGNNNPPDAWAAWQLGTYYMPYWLAGEPMRLGINQHIKTTNPAVRLWTDPMCQIRPTDEQMQNLRAMIIRSVERISSGLFEPGPSSFGCPFLHPAWPSFSIVVPELVAS